MSNITLVTSLVDLKRGSLSESFSRSFDHYLESFKKLLLLKDYPLVIYCDKDTEDFVWKYRSRSNTGVIRKDVSSMKSSPFKAKVDEIRTKKEWYSQASWLEESPQAKLEYYNPLVMSKQFMLNDAAISNSFGSKYFFWIDAGIANTVNIESYFNSDQFDRKLAEDVKKNKMLYLAFPYDGQHEVHGFKKEGMNKFAGEDTKYVCRGGFFGGTREAINKVNEVYYRTLESTLNHGYMGTEESVFTITTYTHKHLFNVQMIEPNGLIYSYFERVKSRERQNDDRLALYFLTFNAPKQLVECLSRLKENFPSDFRKSAKYLINNSTKKELQPEYDKIIKEYDLIEHKFDNIGITGGRQFAAEHFSQSNHSYTVFFEDDMLINGEEEAGKLCNAGFKKYDKDLFNKSISILEENELDYLKLSFSEFFGNNHTNWAWYNLDPGRKEKFLQTDDIPEMNTKTFYSGCHQKLAYSVGEYFYCNWPILFSKEGNSKFMKLCYTHNRMAENSLMAEAQVALRKGKLKVGCLLASPITHKRIIHYGKGERVENKK